MNQQIRILDTRNSGGLKQVADNMYFHHKALINAKPAILIKPPKPHVNAKQQKKVDLPMFKNKKDFNTVFKTFQTVLEMKKGGIDSSAPQSMNFRRNITGNISKAEKHQHSQHFLNLQSQQRRIDSACFNNQKLLANKTERKKNLSDPIQHPIHFFRRDGQSLATLRIDKLMEHMVIDMIYYKTKQHRNLDTSQVQTLIDYKNGQKHGLNKSIQNQRTRPQSAKPPTRKSIQTVNIKVNQQDSVCEFADQVPQVKGNQLADYEILKKELIGTIFKYRIHRSDDLEALFGRVLVHNPQLELEKTEKIFDDIRDEFEK